MHVLAALTHLQTIIDLGHSVKCDILNQFH
jgi:hypothetical protein